jgi:hypothetical protein
MFLGNGNIPTILLIFKLITSTSLEQVQKEQKEQNNMALTRYYDERHAVGVLYQAAPNDPVLAPGATLKGLKEFGLKPKAVVRMGNQRHRLYDPCEVLDRGDFIAQCVKQHGHWNRSFLKNRSRVAA